jgi:hypothetical protein
MTMSGVNLRSADKMAASAGAPLKGEGSFAPGLGGERN